MKYPIFSTHQAREKSFATWLAKQSIDEMIDAGFFYSGKLDLVYCFHCGLALFQWEENDDPKTEHLKWSKYCGYMNTSDKGVDVCGIRDIIPGGGYDSVCGIRDPELEGKVDIFGNMIDEVSDLPPKVKRRNTL